MTGPSFTSFDAWDWEHLPVSARNVLERWWSLLRGDAPWRDMYPDDRFGGMRRIVDELLNEARDPDDGTRPHRLAASARAHGDFRREQLCRGHDVLREVCALRVAIASLLLEAGWSHQLVAESVIVLELDLASVRAGVRRSWRRGGAGADGVAT